MRIQRSSSSLIRAHSHSSLSRLLVESEQCNGPSVGNSRSWVFRVIQVFVFLCRLVTPFAYIFLIFFIRFQLKTIFKQSLISIIFTLWMLVETIFFPYYYSLFRHLSKPNNELEHFAQNIEMRDELVYDCMDAVKSICRAPYSPDSFEQHMRKFIEGWFLDLPLLHIRYGNIAAWTAWAFFSKNVKDMTKEEIFQNNKFVEYFEKSANWKFPKGCNPDAVPIRLNLDPIFVTQRPWFFYAAIYGLNGLTHLILKAFGFKKMKIASNEVPQSIYLREASSYGESSKSMSTLPLVFVHGIGVGFAHYLLCIMSLPRETDIFLVEWPYVAMQGQAGGPAPKQAISMLRHALSIRGHTRATFLAHSLGTVLVSWLLRECYYSNAQCLVASTILIDPIGFLLCEPRVASVFVYKDPTTSIDLLMHFFLSRELFISHALSRHFSWSFNAVFAEDLLNIRPCCQQMRTMKRVRYDSDWFQFITESERNIDFSLEQQNCAKNNKSGLFDKEKIRRDHFCAHSEIDHTLIFSLHDSIVPVPDVLRYLQSKRLEGISNFEVLTFDGSHGEIFLYPSWISKIASKVRHRCGL